MSTHTLNVNGQAHTVEAAPETPLLWVLRDQLGLVGTKYGCGVGQCGACTVHIDGAPTRSCLMPVGSLAGLPVLTIEGLDAQGTHPLQQAWQELDVPQCGYCQAGQLMSAVALLKRTPKPNNQDIDAAMAGNLCRCATFTRIRAGIHRAVAITASASAAPKKEAL